MGTYLRIGRKALCVGHKCSMSDVHKDEKTKPEHELLKFNFQGALGHMLAMEEHMAQLGTSKISDSWCHEKHYLLASNHHITEAVIHLQEVNPKKAEELKAFQQDFKEYMEHPDLGELRRLRNRFREIIDDPTLKSECPLCKMDYTGAKGT